MNERRKKLVILGYGGYGRVVEDIASQLGLYKNIVFLDDQSDCDDVIGKCSEYESYIDAETAIYPAFGNNELRCQWIEKLMEAGAFIPTMIHPTAYVSPTASIEAGTIILPKAVVNSYSVIKQGCIINLGCMIDHNCVIGAASHICLGAIIKADNHIPSCMKIDAGVVIENKTYKGEL